MSDYRTNNEYLKTIAGDESSDYHTNNEYLKQIAEQGGGGGGGTDNYANLTNKPKINNVVLVGDKTAKELGLVSNAEFETLEDKVDELQLYKFPNAVIVGNPTINNGQISGFSQANYLKFPFLVDFKGKPFVIDMEFTTGANVTSQENIIDSDFGLAFAVRNGRFVIAIGSNGTSWDIGEGVGTYTVLANTAYKVKIAWNGSQYTVAYSVDGGENYTTDITKASTKQPYPTQVYIGVGENEAQVVNHFTGIINLNNAELRIDNNIVWTGMDDVGLATRLATDLGNIDEAGIAKVKDIITTEDYIKNDTPVGYDLTINADKNKGKDAIYIKTTNSDDDWNGEIRIDSDGWIVGEATGQSYLRVTDARDKTKRFVPFWTEYDSENSPTKIVKISGDKFTFNDKDVATIDALQPVWISNLMTTDLELDIVSDDELKLLSRQIVYILKNYNFMVLKMYIDDGNETLIRNQATGASSGDGSIVCPVYTDVMGRYRKVEEYILLGDEVHEILLSFLLDLSTNVLHFTITPCYNVTQRISWAYNTVYDAIVNQTFTFDYVAFSKMAGFIPYTGDKAIIVN